MFKYSLIRLSRSLTRLSPAAHFAALLGLSLTIAIVTPGPVASRPSETKPADKKPAVTKPVDKKPAATKPADTTPVRTSPAPNQERSKPTTPKADIKGSRLVVQTYSRGKQIVYLSPTAVRIDDPAKATIVISQAPDWTLTMYGLKNKNFYQRKVDSWRGQIAVDVLTMVSNRLDEMKPTSYNTTKMLGMNCRVTRMLQIIVRKGVDQEVSREQESGTYFTTKDLATDPIATLFIAQYFRLPKPPEPGSVPLRFEYFNSRDNKYLEMNTIAITKENFPATTFVLPTGMHQVNSESQVLINADSRSDLEDLLVK